ncbi:MAG: hypothetical protein HYX41_00535 [Bdellovibrio sp.]|nr:hypothetical protein [Bdellovibrio sp.]
MISFFKKTKTPLVLTFSFFITSCLLASSSSYAGLELVLHVVNENFGDGAETYDRFQNEAEAFYNSLSSLSKYNKETFFPAPLKFSEMNRYQTDWEYKTYPFSEVEMMFSAVFMDGRMSGVVKSFERTFFDLKSEKKRVSEVVLNLPELNDVREIRSLHFSVKAAASRFPERNTSTAAAVLGSTFRAPVTSVPSMALYSDATRTGRVHLVGLVSYKGYPRTNGTYENTVLELTLLTQGSYKLDEVPALKGLVEIKN